jgi:YggT family protein
MQTLAQIAIYILTTLGTLYISLVLMRFLLQLVRADYYNPISKALVKYTNPLLVPLRKVVPGLFGIDLAALILAILLQAVLLEIVILLKGFSLDNLFALIPWALVQIFSLLLSFFKWGALILIIASFIAPLSYNPALALLRQVIDPAMAPFRKILPPFSGLDFSPIIFFMVLNIITSYLLPLAANIVGMPMWLLI